ncbi:unnamed protein product, partial [Phaeothamnion confervicola]
MLDEIDSELAEIKHERREKAAATAATAKARHCAALRGGSRRQSGEQRRRRRQCPVVWPRFDASLSDEAPIVKRLPAAPQTPFRPAASFPLHLLHFSYIECDGDGELCFDPRHVQGHPVVTLDAGPWSLDAS